MRLIGIVLLVLASFVSGLATTTPSRERHPKPLPVGCPLACPCGCNEGLPCTCGEK